MLGVHVDWQWGAAQGGDSSQVTSVVFEPPVVLGEVTQPQPVLW